MSKRVWSVLHNDCPPRTYYHFNNDREGATHRLVFRDHFSMGPLYCNRPSLAIKELARYLQREVGLSKQESLEIRAVPITKKDFD